MQAQPPGADETAWRRPALVFALLVTLTGTIHLSQVLRWSTWRSPWIVALLLIAEVYSVLAIVSLAWSVTRWRRRGHRPAPPWAVDVLIPTLDEPPEVLGPTVRAAAAMRHTAPVRVVVLDDGDRPWVAELAADVGATYLARPGSEGAKAGNLNAGLALTAPDAAPVLCVFDADHVPQPEFLERMVGQLDRPQVAVAQAPQTYALDGTRAVRVGHDQQLMFCDRIAPSLDSFDSMFCIGTNFVARREAIDDIGGFPHALTEDLVTTLLLRKQGWRLVYVHEHLCEGLAPPTFEAFLKQQTRWATGTFDAWSKHPGVLRHLRLGEVWQYLTVPLNWFYGITLPIYMTIAMLDLWLGWRPFDSGPSWLLWTEGLWAVSALTCLFTIVRGKLGIDAFLVRWGTFPITFRALWRAATERRRIRFDVSAKVRTAGEPAGGRRYLWISVAIAGAMLGAVLTGDVQTALILPLVVSATNALALAAFALRIDGRDRAWVEPVPAVDAALGARAA